MRRLICLFTVLVLAVCCCSAASALQASTLHNGSRGDSVRALQQALITLGYLSGKADGIFGNKTEQAVRAFQASRNLTVDGLAGKKTQSLLLEAASGANTGASAADTSSQASPSSNTSSGNSSGSAAADTSTSSSSSGNLFSGNYATIKIKDQGNRVKILQQALIRLKYLSGKADGVFGNKTLDAVVRFQKDHKLSADGLAGKKTLTALEKAVQSGDLASSAAAEEIPVDTTETPAPAATPSPAATAEPAGSPSSAKTAKAPDGGTIQLLHWFNDIKPSLKNGAILLIYDPSTGISWNLKVLSRGRHCDSEPLTKTDTENMVKAFGGENTWNQKGVYVKLPSGVWTIGSTHDMPHMSGNIKDNGFDGHLCVHFLRDMSEAKQNDPSYGVANQETIRKLWKSLTGEDLEN